MKDVAATRFIPYGMIERVTGVKALSHVHMGEMFRVTCDFEIDPKRRSIDVVGCVTPGLVKTLKVVAKAEIYNSMESWSYPTTLTYHCKSGRGRVKSTGPALFARVKDLRNLNPCGATIRLGDVFITKLELAELDPTSAAAAPPAKSAQLSELTLVRKTRCEPQGPPPEPEIIVIDNPPQPQPPEPTRLSVEQTVGASAEKLRDMMRELRVIEAAIRKREEALEQERLEQLNCAVCMEKPKNTALSCGHMVCEECQPLLTSCPICRSRLVGKGLKVFQ